MKNLTNFAVIVVVLAVGSYVWADHHESSWFDGANCDLCKSMVHHEDLMHSMKWETHKIKDGMLMTTSVPERHLKTFRDMCDKREEIENKHIAGAKPQGLCGFCDSMGKLLAKGANLQKIDTQDGRITLVTAKDPATVKMIHQHAERTQDEAKKMLAATQ